jgi:hypothetical protein
LSGTTISVGASYTTSPGTKTLYVKSTFIGDQVTSVTEITIVIKEAFLEGTVKTPQMKRHDGSGD